MLYEKTEEPGYRLEEILRSLGPRGAGGVDVICIIILYIIILCIIMMTKQYEPIL